ncbi:MAG: primosomal protein N' [Vallitaleaceae bacterium]|nr:primosomal protein N' [Vallitaleaceae bacterium]
MIKKYAQIIISISVKSLDRIFTYGVPETLRPSLRIGSIVEIPFGAGNRIIRGYILGFCEEIDFDPTKVKYILKQYEELGIESELLDLAVFMKNRYVTTMQSALGTLLPSRPNVRKKEEKWVRSLMDQDQLLDMMGTLKDKKIYEPRRRVLEVLLVKPYIPLKEIMEEADVSRGIITTMVKHLILEFETNISIRMPYDLEAYDTSINLAPNKEQDKALTQITQSIQQKENKVFLLHGITGSGKTEVYMQAIEQVLKVGQSAIVMIPEIALTPLMVKRFVERFGEVVGVMHSRLSEGERFDQWRLAKEGRLKIMIGPRSAIFAPFEKIGLIILDEEHETSYKSEMPPKYHAREVAIYRARYHMCPVLLGSATPLVESYYKALSGKYTLIELDQKAEALSPLEVETVDMRKELENGNTSILSHELYEAIKATLLKKEQIILFLNRRGHSNFVSCRLCGYVLKCNHCDVAYNYHKYNHKLQCHYCNESIPMVQICPSCGSKHVKAFGIGTQKVEAYIKEIFSEAKVLRMDYDTTTGKDGHKRILDLFEAKEADILIGTQMVAKGHHFKNVTLVGVLAADMSLYVNDFRASEKTFQLVTQVTGRSGRGDKAGRAIIQTYTPDHYSIMSAQNQDYKNFYNNEIQYRKLMGYAPFKEMMSVLIISTDEKYLIQLCHRIKEQLSIYEHNKGIEILGPSPATLSKIRNNFRWVIYIKADSYKALTALANHLYNINEQEDHRHISHMQIDLNPMMSY